MSFFTTPVALVGFVLGFYLVSLIWLQRDLRNTLSGKVRALVVVAFGVLPCAAIGFFWSPAAVAISVVTALVLLGLAFACYDADKRSREGFATPTWLKML